MCSSVCVGQVSARGRRSRRGGERGEREEVIGCVMVVKMTAWHEELSMKGSLFSENSSPSLHSLLSDLFHLKCSSFAHPYL